MRIIALAVAFFVVVAAGLAQAQPVSVGQAVGPNSVDATKFSGSDMCAKIANAFASLLVQSPGGGAVDARGFSGVQPCAAGPFTGWPTIGTTGFSPSLIFGCNVTWQTDVPIAIPSAVRVRGQDCPDYHYGVAADSGRVASAGFNIQASNAFPSHTATVTITNATPGVITDTAHGLLAGQAIMFTTTGTLPTGLSPGAWYYVLAAGLTANAYEVATTPGGTAINTSSAGSGTHTSTSLNPLVTMGTQVPPTCCDFGVELSHAYVTCNKPNGTVAAGAIGVANIESQENTTLEYVHIFSCHTGLVVAKEASDGASYRHLLIFDFPHVSSADYVCLQVGLPAETPTFAHRSADFEYIGCHNVDTSAANLILLDAQFFSLRHIYFEHNAAGGATNYINIGSAAASQAANIELVDIVCDGGVQTTGDCIHITSSNGPIQISLVEGGDATNLIKDTRTGGCTIPEGFSAGQEFYVGKYITGTGSNFRVLSDSIVCHGAPTITSCGTSAALLNGNDYGGTITVGSTASTTSCVVTFKTPFPAAPSCTAGGKLSSTPVAAFPTTISSTAMTITTASSVTSGQIQYTCAPP